MTFYWCIISFFSFLFSDPPGRFQISGFAQGTSYQIIYYADSNYISKNQIEAVFSELDSSLSIYKPYSLINRFNQSSTGIKLDQHLKKVVEKALEISERTSGTFDISVYPLTDAWGFGINPSTFLPDSSKIAALLECTGVNKLHLLQDSLVKSLPCVKIDVNGIAQGYSVDVIAQFLEARRIHHYLVEIGGEIKVKGRKQPSGSLFVIGLEQPVKNNNEFYSVEKKIQLENGAITSSGNYRKYFLEENKKKSHLIDPKTGYPINNDMISVTVLAKDALTADGYDNALMVMGLKEALNFLDQQKGLEAYIIYHKPDGVVADTATAGFYRLLK